MKMSGFAKFFNEDLSECHHEDFDPGVNAMALLCGLVLSVPYTVVEGLDYGHLDWLKSTLALCPKDARSSFITFLRSGDHDDETVKAAAIAMRHSSKIQASAAYNKGAQPGH